MTAEEHGGRWTERVVVLYIVSTLSFVSVIPVQRLVDVSSSDLAGDIDVAEQLRSLGDYFTENRGQVTDGIRFYSRGNPSVGFRDDGVMFVMAEINQKPGETEEWKDSMHLQNPTLIGKEAPRFYAYMMRFEGANKVVPVGTNMLPFRSNFFIGNDSSEWRTDVPNYGEVIYRSIYEGVDLAYSIARNRLKYEFRIMPGISPEVIEMRYEGIDSLKLEGTAIAVETRLGETHDSPPYSYQEDGSEVTCDFALRGVSSYGFECEGWNPQEALIIDPLVYSTYLGGQEGDDMNSMAVDSAGNVYLTGHTYSLDFPVTPGAFDTAYGGGQGDAFVTKLGPNGSALVYSTFLAGNHPGSYRWDIGYGIYVDAMGNAYVTGETACDDFPTTAGAYDTTFNGGYSDVFVTKLNPAGNDLIYSTFIGSSPSGSYEYGWAVVVDTNGSAYIAGMSILDYPVTPGAFSTNTDWSMDIFVTKFNAAGSALIYSALFGGSNPDWGLSIEVDPTGNLYLTGLTDSVDFPVTPGAFDTSYGGSDSGSDAYVLKLNSAGSGLIYSTYVGGRSSEWGYSIEVDSLGNVYVAGDTYSSDFPTTPGAYDTSYNGSPDDAYVVKLNASGSSLVYSTFLGGYGIDEAYSLDLDSAGNIFVTGVTMSLNFPTTPDAYQKSMNGGNDAFVCLLDATGSALINSTYFGGSDWEQGRAVKVDDSGYVYVAGDTWSSDLPTTSGAFDRTYNGEDRNFGDVFIAKLQMGKKNSPPVADVGGPYGEREGDTIGFDVSASSDPDGDSLQFRWDFQSDGVWDTPWSASPIANHTWGDDYEGKVTVEVSDGILTDTDAADVVVGNVLPSGVLSVATIEQHEGTTIHFSAHVTDPGSDDIFLRWSWGDGTPDETSAYYNDGVGPDLYPSTDIHPRDITEMKSHTYGDNGEYAVSFFVSDDDSGNDGTRLTSSATPDNLSPSVSVAGGMSIDEGQSVTLTATATDPGSDDLTFAWEWGEGSNEKRAYFNDGANPDPPQSPGGKWPFTAVDTAIHQYGDNGLYPVTLMVTDDDGGSSSWSGQVVVRNLPPSITPFGPFTVNEGEPVSITATATDAGSDDLSFTWQWDYGPIDTATFYNDGIGPDPPQSPFGTFPFAAADDASHTYGDDCPCNVTLTVTDDDGGTATYTTTVNVLNLAPSLAGEIEAYAKGSIVLRVAGEKWHDVTATIYRNGVEEMAGRVVRTPGSPDDQAVTLGEVTFDLLSSDVWSAKVVYTPEDDPINGQPNGADPAWIIFRSEHGNESRLHHTFNVQHNETWTWDVPDLKTLLVGIPLDFQANATDPGSDDLTSTWDWEDGTPATATTYFNDGIGPDPYPSPGGTFPFTAVDMCVHAYAMAGTYTVTLRVSDDDGGMSEVRITIVI